MFWFCFLVFGLKRHVLFLVKNAGTHQKVLVLFKNYWNEYKLFALAKKVGTNKNFWFCSIMLKKKSGTH
jgi:hypothetical protein